MKYRVSKIQTITTTCEAEAQNGIDALELVQSNKAEEVDYENGTHYETEELED